MLCVEPQTGVSVNVLMVPVEYVAGAGFPFGSNQPLGVAPNFHKWSEITVTLLILLTVKIIEVVEPHEIGTLAGVTAKPGGLLMSICTGI